jgi:hypothetical protein
MPKISFYLAGSNEELTFTINETTPTVKRLLELLPLNRWGCKYHLRLYVTTHTQFKYVWRDLIDLDEIIDLSNNNSNKRVILQAVPIEIPPILSLHDDNSNDLIMVDESEAWNSLNTILTSSKTTAHHLPSPSSSPPPSSSSTSHPTTEHGGDNVIIKPTTSNKSIKSTTSTNKKESSSSATTVEGVTPLKNLFSGAFAAIKKNLEGDF